MLNTESNVIAPRGFSFAVAVVLLKGFVNEFPLEALLFVNLEMFLLLSLAAC